MFAELQGRGAFWYRAGIGAFRLYARALGVRVWQTGPGAIPRSGGFVLVTNHSSYLDAFPLGLMCQNAGRQPRVLVKQSLFETPFVGTVMRDMGHLAVSRASSSADSVRGAVDALTDGTPVCLFPEGTISRSFTLQPFRPGAVRIATEAQVPIIPVTIWGAHRLFTVDGHLHATRRVPILTHLGTPFTAHLAGSRESARHAVDANTQLLQASMAATLRELQVAYAGVTRPEPGVWWMPAALGGGAPPPEIARHIDLGRKRVERAAPR